MNVPIGERAKGTRTRVPGVEWNEPPAGHGPRSGGSFHSTPGTLRFHRDREVKPGLFLTAVFVRIAHGRRAAAFLPARSASEWIRAGIHSLALRAGHRKYATRTKTAVMVHPASLLTT